MKIEIENVGLVEKTAIAIDGITVIAGENGSGKSTISKALFASFNGLRNLSKKVSQVRSYSIKSLIDDFIYSKYDYDFLDEHEVSSRIFDEVINQRDLYSKDADALGNRLIEILKDVPISQDEDDVESDEKRIFESSDNLKEDVERGLAQVALKIQKNLCVANSLIKERIMLDQLNEEFDRQILNFNTKASSGSITLTIKGEFVRITVSRDSVESDAAVKILNDIILQNDVIYLDNPSILDNLDRRIRKSSSLFSFMTGNKFSRFAPPIIQFKHEDVLRSQIKKNELQNYIGRDDSQNYIEKILADNKMKEIIECVNSVSSGNLDRKDGKYSYSINGKNVNIANLSSGLKTFITLKQLLTQGVIKEKSMVIIDEPEVHLHPEWQVLFAKIIVLVQRKFDVNFLINTHSPYFMEAIDVFASKFGLGKDLRCYLSEKDKNGNAFVEDVTGNIQKAYAHLARPFQDLENIRHSDDL
jgi:predicted ATPase